MILMGRSALCLKGTVHLKMKIGESSSTHAQTALYNFPLSGTWCFFPIMKVDGDSGIKLHQFLTTLSASGLKVWKRDCVLH